MLRARRLRLRRWTRRARRSGADDRRRDDDPGRPGPDGRAADADAARARAGGGAEPRAAHRHRQGLDAARLHPVERGARLRVPRGRGLAAGRLPARPGREDGDDRQPAHRGQPAELPPRDRHPVRPRRRVGRVGRPLDRRGGPARCRAARLPGGHPRRRPGQAREPADDPHGRRVRLRREGDAADRRLRLVPGARDPGEPPQHRQGHRLPGGRAAAAADRRRREPAHGLLPEHDGRGLRPRPGRHHGGGAAPRWSGSRCPVRPCRTSTATR